MGLYLNPGNEGFKTILNSMYVDKTGVIDVINNTLGSTDKLTCISRPRRFGKSYTAKVLCAYYDCTCNDSKALFNQFKIASCSSYEKYLGKYNVIYIDVTGFISKSDIKESIVDEIRNSVKEEMLMAFPFLNSDNALGEMLVNAVNSGASKFFFVIDEWDALFREYKNNKQLLENYINLLRELFKNGNVTDKAISGAFMTGILPIKKYGHQSAISDFREYTMIQPSIFAEYVGFTESDIDWIEKNYTMDRSILKKWYDGYAFPGVGDIYNPNSVSQAVRTGVYDTYWTKTETYNALLEYINMDTDGLKADLIQMVGGNEMSVDTSTFQNDLTSIKSRDDVLSLLIHLGYLAYDNIKQKARIPNEEIRREFLSTIRLGTHDVTNKIIKNSDQLLIDTIDGDEEAVAKAISEAHEAGTFGTSPLFYNDEQALRSIVKFAYISCANEYMKIEELPSGRGYADIVYIPAKNNGLPALLIELKMDSTSVGAIAQIREKHYPKVLKDYFDEVILCGINYNSKTKIHTCKIEKLQKDAID